MSSEEPRVEVTEAVADSSVPPADGGANPTLTAQAFATRTAEKIAERYFS